MTNKALQYFLDLKANGATDAEAKAQTEALTSVLEGVATKEDLLKLATKDEIKDLKAEIALVNDRIDINHRWIMAFLIANFVAFATLILTNVMRG